MFGLEEMVLVYKLAKAPRYVHSVLFSDPSVEV
jgi:hypothetical protein